MSEAVTTHSGGLGAPTLPREVDAGANGIPEQPSAAATAVEEVEICCGTARGVLLVHKAKVVCEGNEMTPTEFEKLGGRASAKKWKASCRVIGADGNTKQAVGDWLQAHNIMPPSSRGSAPRAPRLSQLRRTLVPRVKEAIRLNFCAPQEVQTHLDRQFLGLLPGDPTASDLPDELPASSQDESAAPRVVVDLANAMHDDLMRLSASSAENPLRALLPTQPGVLQHRLASITGHKRLLDGAPRPNGPAKGSMEAAAALADYLSGRTDACPWHSLGARGPIIIDGKELDLRRLHELVQQPGGYRHVCANKLWPSIASSLKINKQSCSNSSYLLRTNYLRFLGALDPDVRGQPEGVNSRRNSQSAEQPAPSAGPSTSQPSSRGVDQCRRGTASQKKQEAAPGLDCEAVSPVRHREGSHTSNVAAVPAPPEILAVPPSAAPLLSVKAALAAPASVPQSSPRPCEAAREVPSAEGPLPPEGSTPVTGAEVSEEAPAGSQAQVGAGPERDQGQPGGSGQCPPTSGGEAGAPAGDRSADDDGVETGSGGDMYDASDGGLTGSSGEADDSQDDIVIVLSSPRTPHVIEID